MLNLEGKRIFISGGAGVIGTELVTRLLQLKADIFVGDLKPRPEKWPASVRYHQGDLNGVTREELEDFAPEYFFHLAATFERSEESYEFWEENERHNVQLSHHLMDCLKDVASLKRVVFASSYLIYNPDQYQFPEPARQVTELTEQAPIYPRNLCGAAKLMHEIELRFLQHFAKGNMTAVSARIYRVYGKNSRDIISRWIQALLNKETVRVFRKEGMFDYIYAGDVAEGLLRLAVSEATGIVNLGNGHARRIKEVLSVLNKHFPDMQSVEGNSDIAFEASQADMTRFEALTGWRPEREIEDTIPELIEHYRGKNSAKNIETVTSAAVLITSVSRKIPLIKTVRSAIHKLGAPIRLIGGDVNEDVLGKYFVDDFWQMPRLDQLSLEHLIEKCRQENIRFIIPTRDGELPFWAEVKPELEHQGIHVMISNIKAVTVCLDKLEFSNKGASLGFPVIPSYEALDHIDGQTYQTYVVKERFGAGSASIGLNLSAEQARHHAELLKQPIFQPYISGIEVSIDVYVQKNGSVKGVVVRKRELVVNGESQVTTTFKHGQLEQMVAEFAKKLGLYGHVIFQAFIDEKDNIHFIECNSRFGGASRLSVEAGLDSFYWFLLEASGTDIAEYPFFRSRNEKRLIRYAEDLIQ